jgi:hypothetical protein
LSGSADSRWAAITGIGTLILVLIGIIAYLQAKSGSSSPPAAASSPTRSAAHAASATTPAPLRGVPASASAPARSFSYATGDPFPLCDTKQARWILSDMTSEAGGCAPSGTQITTAVGTYGFDTTSSFLGLSTLPQSSTVTVAGTLPDSADGYHSRFLGSAEGNSETGYFGYICNSCGSCGCRWRAAR